MSTLEREIRELARGWLLLSPTFAPYLTRKGRKAAEKLRRSLADATQNSPHTEESKG